MRKRSFMDIAKKFFEPVLAAPKIYIKAVFPYVLWASLPIVTLILLERITKAVELGNKLLFERYLLIFAVSMVVYQLLVWLVRRWGRLEIRTLWYKKLYPPYIRKFLRLENTAIERIGTGRMISIIEQGFSTWIKLIERLFQDGIELIISLVFIGISVCRIGVEFFAGFLLLLVFVQLVVHALSQRIKKSKYEEAWIKSERSRALIKIIMSKFEIQQQWQYEKEIQHIHKNMDENYRNIAGRLTKVHTIFFFPEGVGAIIAFAVFWVLGYGVFDGEFSYSTLVLFAGVLTLSISTTDKLATFVKQFIQEFGTIQKLWDTFEDIAVMQDDDDKKKYIYRSWVIQLDGVSFAYGKDSKIFEGFDIKLLWKKKTALVWPSWWGKSTLIKLIAGYIRPDAGEVIVDKQALSGVKLSDYYKHIGYLTQDPSVFDWTILDNLTYALTENPKKEELEKIVKMARCEFILDFEKGLKTEIGERWVRLSWWQKQRLAIAKIMLKNPEIILLDEPTSALDSVSEQKISEALHNLFKGKTVIVIAHRLQTVKEADDIVVIDKWAIVERGTHKQLEKKGGLYKQMLDLQTTF